MSGLTTENTEGTEGATPQTDALATYRPNDTGFDDWTPAEFSRRLERERDEARDQCKALWSLVEIEKKKNYDSRKERDEAIADRDIARLSALESDRAHDRMVGELEGVYKERDEAREALEYVACSGLSARHLKDYAVDFLKRLEARP